MTRLHQPHVIVVRLHLHIINVVILTPETAVNVGVWAVAYPCPVGFSIQDEALDAARSAARGLTTMRTLFTCSLNWDKRRDQGPYLMGLHQISSRPTAFIPRWTTHPCILYQVCATRVAVVVVADLIIGQYWKDGRCTLCIIMPSFQTNCSWTRPASLLLISGCSSFADLKLKLSKLSETR